jgi:hypothetical protein
MKRSFLLAAVAALLLASLVAGAGPAPAGMAKATRPQLLLSLRNPVVAFTQDSNAIAWVGSGFNVHVRSLVTSASATVGTAMPNARPNWIPTLALAGTRALWTRWGGGNSLEVSVWTSSLGDRPTLIEVFSSGMEFPGGVFFGGAAGDGPTLVYGRAPEQCDNPNDPTTCHSLTVVGGGVVLVTGQYEQAPVTGIPAPALLGFAGHDPQSGTISQGLIAIAPAATPVVTDLYRHLPRVAPNGPVQVYRLSRKAVLVSTVAPRGTVEALALSFNQLAVLVQRTDGKKVIERYNPLNGTPLGSVAVPITTASDLSVGSAGTVFRAGKRIYLLAGKSSKLVWTTKAMPIGLSIEGRRIAWAVNISGARIMTLTIPR